MFSLAPALVRVPPLIPGLRGGTWARQAMGIWKKHISIVHLTLLKFQLLWVHNTRRVIKCLRFVDKWTDALWNMEELPQPSWLHAGTLAEQVPSKPFRVVSEGKAAPSLVSLGGGGARGVAFSRVRTQTPLPLPVPCTPTPGQNRRDLAVARLLSRATTRPPSPHPPAAPPSPGRPRGPGEGGPLRVARAAWPRLPSVSPASQRVPLPEALRAPRRAQGRVGDPARPLARRPAASPAVPPGARFQEAGAEPPEFPTARPGAESSCRAAAAAASTPAINAPRLPSDSPPPSQRRHQRGHRARPAAHGSWAPVGGSLSPWGDGSLDPLAK